MAPVSVFALDSDQRDAVQAVLRFKRDTADLDSKVVGSHLPLSKRNSTPYTVYDFGVSTQSCNYKKVTPGSMSAFHQQQLSCSPPETNGHHRKLDRSQSDPLRQQQPSPTGSSTGSSGTTSSSRYKTELCRPFGETGFCKYGDKCQFAHGGDELRSMPRHPKYKTELCRTFHTTGLCGYGTRCHFIHNADERRSPPMSSHSSPPASVPAAPIPTGPTNPMVAIQTQQRPPALVSGLPFLPSGEEHQPPSILASPPHSLNGSPPATTGTFFNNNFHMYQAQKDLFEQLDGISPPHSDLVNETFGSFQNILMQTLPTPPTSPMDVADTRSLGDDTLGVSMGPVDACSSLFENKFIRLPIFETMGHAEA